MSYSFGWGKTFSLFCQSGGFWLAKGPVFHERGLDFDIAFYQENANSPQDEKTHKDGEIYITGNDLFLGKDQKWFRMHVSEIEKIIWPSKNRKLKLEFENFYVTLFSTNLAYLKALRHYIFLLHNHQRKGDAS